LSLGSSNTSIQTILPLQRFVAMMAISLPLVLPRQVLAKMR